MLALKFAEMCKFT